MALDTLSSLMIVVCVVALIILLSLVAYTWVKWHRKEVQSQMQPVDQLLASPATEEIELTSRSPQPLLQQGHVKVDSPNLSGSQTFLNDDVLKQKSFPKDGNGPAFQSNDVVYHANAERNPDEFQAGDIVLHAKEPFNKTTDEVEAGHVAFNTEEMNGQRRRVDSSSKDTFM